MNEDQQMIPIDQSETDSYEDIKNILDDLQAQRSKLYGMQKKFQYDIDLFHSKMDGIEYMYKKLHKEHFEAHKNKISEIHAHLTHLSGLIMGNSNPLNGYITNIESEIRETIDNTMHAINNSLTSLNLNSDDYKSTIDEKFSEIMKDINATFGDLRMSEDAQNSRRLTEIETIIEKSNQFLNKFK